MVFSFEHSGAVAYSNILVRVLFRQQLFTHIYTCYYTWLTENNGKKKNYFPFFNS